MFYMFFAYVLHTVRDKKSHCKHTVEFFHNRWEKKDSKSILWLATWQNHQTVGREILKQYREKKT